MVNHTPLLGKVIGEELVEGLIEAKSANEHIFFLEPGRFACCCHAIKTNLLWHEIQTMHETERINNNTSTANCRRADGGDFGDSNNLTNVEIFV